MAKNHGLSPIDVKHMLIYIPADSGHANKTSVESTPVNPLPFQTFHFETCCGHSESGLEGSFENNPPIVPPIPDADPMAHCPILEIHQMALPLFEIQDCFPLTIVDSSYEPDLDP